MGAIQHQLDKKQEAQLLLRKHHVSFVHSSYHNATLGHLGFLSLVIRYMWDL